jgi:S1-C subfamily serine protease
MDVPQREACTTCAEPVAVEARVCPYCGHSALVELRLAGPVADGRARYQVARALAALGAPFPAVGALQKAMAEPRPRLATGLTRGKAMSGQVALEAAGLQGQLQPAPAPGGAGLKIAGGVALGVVAATLVAWWALRPSPTTPAKGEAAVMAGQAGGTVIGAAGGASAPELGRNELARIALASTASLRCADSVGAGFFVAEGVLLTNQHVLCSDGSPLKVVLADKREAIGVPARSDEELDLALVNVSGLSAPPLPLGDAGAIDVGDRVLMVGSPVGMDFTVHEGMVSAMGRVILGIAYIQLDAKVNPGNSGGPLLDARGRVVGIVSLKRSDAEGIALALPVNYAWSGGRSLLEPPAGRSSSSFEAILARAQDEDRALAGKLASEEMRPLLAGVAVNEYREVMAQVLRPARSQPYYQEFSFKVWNGNTEVCTMSTSVNDWKQIDVPEAASRSSARAKAWLDKHGLTAQLYLGNAPLRLDLCARDQLQPGVQLELQGAEPNASRVMLY